MQHLNTCIPNPRRVWCYFKIPLRAIGKKKLVNAFQRNLYHAKGSNVRSKQLGITKGYHRSAASLDITKMELLSPYTADKFFIYQWRGSFMRSHQLTDVEFRLGNAVGKISKTPARFMVTGDIPLIESRAFIIPKPDYSRHFGTVLRRHQSIGDLKVYKLVVLVEIRSRHTVCVKSCRVVHLSANKLSVFKMGADAFTNQGILLFFALPSF